MTIESDERFAYALDMESRISQLEAKVDHMQRDIDELKAEVRAIRTTDFRLLFSAIIAVALGVASLLAKGFGWF